ncbi:unnamed protein product [Miscanthus lutarioriparius]|uniref:Uncharacterized protein n=1 Tax=Miscanthus lutarioriparius TaxID=422564 RepID=A0A811R2A7_9POAL|nr:unnamed protein product [Miscanthus lutarioriparius]
MDGGFVAPSDGCALPLSCGALGLCTPKGCTCPPSFAASRDSDCAPSDASAPLSVSSCGGTGGGGNNSLPVSYLSLGNGVEYFANKLAPPTVSGDNHQLGSLMNADSTKASDKLGYIKVQSSQLSRPSSNSSSNSTLIAILLPTVVAFVLIVVVSATVIRAWRKEVERSSRSRDMQLRRMQAAAAAWIRAATKRFT